MPDAICALFYVWHLHTDSRWRTEYEMSTSSALINTLIPRNIYWILAGFWRPKFRPNKIGHQKHLTINIIYSDGESMDLWMDERTDGSDEQTGGRKPVNIIKIITAGNCEEWISLIKPKCISLSTIKIVRTEINFNHLNRMSSKRKQKAGDNQRL